MGYRKPIELNSIITQLRKAYIEVNSPYNDGFTGWETKRELYEIKFLLDEIIKESTSFGEIEERYLNEVNKLKVWRELKK
jgi:hypothetical protein